jgi:hypothetical protein
MVNSTKTSIDDVIQTIEILQTMNKYILVILYFIGVCGASLNIITFLQKQLRVNPCAVYFLSTSIVDFGVMNVFVLMEIIAALNIPVSDFIYATRIWCKFGNFIRFTCPCLSSSYLTLASIDRFCISSLNETLRKWSNLKISRIVVVIVFIIWALLGLHYPIAYDVIQDPLTMTTQCQVAHGSPTIFLVIDGFFFSLFNGAIIPFILCIFGLLIYYNMKRSRNRVDIQQNTRSHRIRSAPVNMIRTVYDRHSFHMRYMLLVQVSLTVILNIPFIIVYLLSYVNNLPTDFFHIMLYFIFSYIGRWLYYMNYCKTFYINTLTSQLFRKSLRQQCRRLFCQRPRE